MIVGIGTDIIEPERIRRALQNPRFSERVFTANERAHIAAANNLSNQRAAGIFAAKEAAVKALGCGFSGLGFADVEIIPDSSGKPMLIFHNRAQEKFLALGGLQAHVSISHIATAAVAFVVLEG